MAKLEGVKTLDMVNGEITKVVYDGSTYERLEGEAQEGDLLLMRRAGLDTTKGAFYYIHSTAGIYANIIDDKDEPHDWSRENYDLFRKVAAEATELKKWTEIGREVGEYKVGDIFRSPGGNLFEITRIDDSCSFPIIFTNLQGDYDGYKRGAAITLITPVEARFDR
ncbi:hypothetical protein ACSQ7W_11775 [Bacillus halotolerans]|uniref:hypothetical protein n=1 Tax=Bacillus halotolerans TaxID=260554 RepID=UPI00403F3D71